MTGTGERILIIGAGGQVGTELSMLLREIHGKNNVVATDIRPVEHLKNAGPFEILDVMDANLSNEIINDNHITTIYNLAAVLSATAEKDPKFAWRLNMEGLLNILDIAADKKGTKVFWPSSIAVFGPDTPKQNTPQTSVMNPTTVYGISKLAGERWCEYYHANKGVDVRSLRYPGLIGYKSLPGGGTTDYAVDIFHQAIKTGNYNCFLDAETTLPMMFMPDAIRATIELMQAPSEKLSVRSSYNVAGFSFSPEEIVVEIQKHLPDFSCTYAPDFRQDIAASWPQSINDDVAKKDWNWRPEYGLKELVNEMLVNIGKMLDNEPVQ